MDRYVVTRDGQYIAVFRNLPLGLVLREVFDMATLGEGPGRYEIIEGSRVLVALEIYEC